MPGRPPRHAPEEFGSEHRRRLSGLPLLGSGVDQGPRQHGDEHGVVDVRADVGDTNLQRRIMRGQPGVEVDHSVVHCRSAGQQVGDGGVVAALVPETGGRPRRRPEPPHHRPIAAVTGVLGLPERRVGRHGGDHRQPGRDPVEHCHAFLTRGDGDVDVLPAGQLFPRQQSELLDHQVVAIIVGRCRPDLERAGCDRGDMGTVPFCRGGQLAAQPAEIGRQFSGGGGGRRADLCLFLLEFPVDGRLVALGSEIGPAFFCLLDDLLARRGRLAVVRVDQEELFFHPEGAVGHADSLRYLRYRRITGRDRRESGCATDRRQGRWWS